jgi:hypothetical protein
MDRIDGYKRTALALAELPAQERDWFLAQLGEQDRLRVTALLQDTPGAPIAAVKAAPIAAREARAPSEAEVIVAASLDTLQSVLTGQPDWVVALVLIECNTAATLNECVNQFLPPRGDRVRTLAARLRESVKPKVRQVIVANIAARVTRYESPQPKQENFESVLHRVTN